MKLKFTEDIYREIFNTTLQQTKGNILEENLRLLGEKNALDRIKNIKEKKLSSICEAEEIINIIENLENKKRINILFKKRYKENHSFYSKNGYEYTGKLIIINDDVKRSGTLIKKENFKASKYISIESCNSKKLDNKIIYEIEFNIKVPKNIPEGIYKEYIYTNIQGYKTQIFNIILNCKEKTIIKNQENIKLYKIIHIPNFSNNDKLEVDNNNIKIVYGEKILNTKIKNIIYKIFNKINILNKFKEKILELEQSIIVINKNYFKKSNENNLSKINLVQEDKKIYEYTIYCENITFKPNYPVGIEKTIQNTTTQEEIKNDINNIKNIKSNLFNKVSQDDIKKAQIANIIQDIKELYNQNLWPDYITFSKIIKLLLDKKDIDEYKKYIYDIEMLMICEEYVHINKLVDEHIYTYLKLGYLNTSLYTGYTEDILKAMNIFQDISVDNLKVYINHAILSNNIAIRFNENLKELCNILGTDKFVHDYCVKNAIDYINSPNNINRNFMDRDLLDIMIKVYDNNRQHYRLLESIVAGYIRMRSIEELDFSYIENLVKYYISSKVFDERSRHIATLIYRYNYNKQFSKEVNNDFIKYLAEVLKYEIIKCDESNIGNEITISTSTTNVNINMEQLGLYPVKLGYSLDDKYMISYVDENNSLIKKRNYIKRNKNMFINEFNIVDDEEFKKFAVEVCVDDDKYNENIKSILLYTLNNEGVLPKDKLLKDAYLLYLKNVLKDKEEKIEEIVEYIESFISKYKHEEDISKEFIDIVYKLEINNTQKAIETLAFICGEYEFDEKMISRIRVFISNNIDEDENQELIYVFDNMEKYISDSRNQIIFKDYLNSLNEIKAQSSNIILKICNKATELNDKYFVSEIIEILLEKSVTEILANLLIQIDTIQKTKFTKLVYDKIKDSYINKTIKFNNNLLKYLIINYKGSINELKQICELLCKNKLDTENYELIYKKVLEYMDEDIVECRNILNLLDYTKAKEYLINTDKIIGKIDEYFIKEIIEKGYYITLQKGFNKLNKEALILKVKNTQLFNILVDYIEEDENTKQVYENNEYNIIIKNPKYLTEIQANLDICDIFKLFIKYIDLYIEMLRYSYELPIIKIESLIVVNNVILPINISKITNQNLVSSTGIAKKDTINNRKYNYSSKDKDSIRVKNIKDCLLKVVKYKHIQKGFKDLIYENIVANDRDDLSLFKSDIINAIKRIKNINSQNLNMNDAINDFDLLSEEQRQDVIKYIIDKNLTSKNAYNNVLYYEKYEGLEKDIYLITNFDINMKSSKKIYKKVCSILEKNFINKESLEKESMKLAYRFFAIGARYKLIKDEKYIAIVNETKFLDDLDKRSLLTLLQRDINTSISKR